MSPQPNSSARYKSNLLNFLNRQSLRLRDQGNRWLRQVKLTTLWGGQIALYPIYALFQAGRLASRQLQQQVQRVFAQLRPATEVPADLAITRLLDALNPEQPPQNQFWMPRRSPQFTSAIIALPTIERIKAIASSRATRELQLITEGNTVIPLPPAQQSQLQQRLVWEIASYWQLWRRYQQRQATLQLPTDRSAKLAIGDRPQLAAPTRWFYQLMDWVQQGPLAHRLNWFEETALVPQPRTTWFQPHLGQLPSDALIRLDGVTNFDWQAWTNQLPQTSPLSQWLKAAIAYFFGRTPPTLTAAPAPPKIADPWDFTLDDANSIEFGAVPLRPTPADEWVVTGRAEAMPLPSVPTRPALPTTAQSRSTKPNLTWANVFANDLTTTLIDTIATPIGYIQHPLERLLGWLDQVLLWLETRIRQLWQWLTSRNLKKH